MRCRAADWVHRCASDQQIEVRAQRSERVVAGRPELWASLPPAVLSDDDARIEMLVEPRSGAHTALWGLHRYPVAGGNAARVGRRGMKLDFRMLGAFAQPRQCAGDYEGG